MKKSLFLNLGEKKLFVLPSAATICSGKVGTKKNSFRDVHSPPFSSLIKWLLPNHKIDDRYFINQRMIYYIDVYESFQYLMEVCQNCILGVVWNVCRIRHPPFFSFIISTSNHLEDAFHPNLLSQYNLQRISSIINIDLIF